MQMIPSFMDTVSHLILTGSHSRSPTALTMLQCGWKQIDCCWILLRLKSSGVHHHGVNTWSRLSLFASATSPYRRSLLSGILVSTWRRRVHEDSSYQHRPSVFLCTASDPQSAMSSSSARSTHAGLNTCHHQVGPMQLRSCGYLRISAGPTAVRAECCCSACLLTSDIGTRLLCSGNCTYYAYRKWIQFWLSHGVSLCAWHSTCGCLRFGGIYPAMGISPLPLEWAWNSLPPQTRAASSILTFRRETKSHLFRQSFGWQKSGTIPAECWLIVHCHWDKSRVTFYW